jgi:hypothetical protein
VYRVNDGVHGESSGGQHVLTFQNNRDRADAAWALLGACVKVRHTERDKSAALIVDGPRSGIIPTRSRATSGGRQAIADVDWPMVQLDSTRNWSENLVESGVLGLGHGSELQLHDEVSKDGTCIGTVADMQYSS